MKDSLKSLILLIFIINSECRNLPFNRFKLLKKVRKEKIHSSDSKSLKTSLQSNFSMHFGNKAQRMSRKLKVKTQKTKIAPALAIYLFTSALDAITNILDGFSADLERETLAMKADNLYELTLLHEHVNHLKSRLCLNIRNSNMFFFDYLSFNIQDIYTNSGNILERLPTLFLMFRGGEKKLNSPILRRNAVHVGKNPLFEIKDENLPEFINFAHKILQPFNHMSNSILNVKEQLKEFQNRICSLNKNIIGEFDYFSARSKGIKATLEEKPQNSFILGAKMIIEFTEVAIENLEEVQEDIEEEIEEIEMEEKSSMLETLAKNQKDNIDKIKLPDDEIKEVDLVKAFQTIIEDPTTAIEKCFEDIKTLSEVNKLWEEPELGENKLEFISKWITSLINFVYTALLLYRVIQVLKNPTTEYKDASQIIESLDSVVENIVEYKKKKEEKAFAISLYATKQKIRLSVFKTIVYLGFYFFKEEIKKGIISFMKYLAKEVFKQTSSTLEDVLVTAMNITMILKIFVSLGKLIFAIFRYIQAKRENIQTKIDTTNEKIIRNNILENLQLQTIFITLKHNTLIYRTLKDLLNYNRMMITGMNYELSRKFDSQMNTNISENISIRSQIKLWVNNKEIRNHKNRIIKFDNYNWLSEVEFFKQFCQENENYCISFIPNKILKTEYRIEEEDIEKLFRNLYYTLTIGPISDIFVMKADFSNFSMDYLVKNNFRFFRNEKFGEEYSILYRRCSNCLNSLVDIKIEDLTSINDYSSIFENISKFSDANSDIYGKNHLQVNMFYINSVKKETDTRKYILTKSILFSSIKEKNESMNKKLLIKLDFVNLESGKIQYEFKQNKWTNYDDAYYSSVKESREIKEDLVIESYRNPCNNNLETKLYLKKEEILNQNYFNKEIRISDKNYYLNDIILDKRFYTDSKSCPKSFHIMKVQIVDIIEKNMVDESPNYMQTHYECFNEKSRIRDLEQKNNKPKDILINQEVLNIKKDVNQKVKEMLDSPKIVDIESENSFHEGFKNKIPKFKKIKLIKPSEDSIENKFDEKKIPEESFSESESILNNSLNQQRIENEIDAKFNDFKIDFQTEAQYKLLAARTNEIKGIVCKSYSIFKYRSKHDSHCTSTKFEGNFDNFGIFKCSNSSYMRKVYTLFREVPPRDNICEQELNFNIMENQIPNLKAFNKIIPIFTNLADKILNENQTKNVIRNIEGVDLKEIIGLYKSSRNMICIECDRKFHFLITLSKKENENNLVFIKSKDIITTQTYKFLKLDYEEIENIQSKSINIDLNENQTKFIKVKIDNKQQKGKESVGMSNNYIDLEPSVIPLIQTNIERLPLNKNYEKIPLFEERNNELKLEFAPIYKYFKLEVRYFTDSWENIENKGVFYLENLNKMLNDCFIMYWPKFSENQETKDAFILKEDEIPEPTMNFFIPLQIKQDNTQLYRIWVKYDYFVNDEEIEKDCEQTLIEEKANIDIVDRDRNHLRIKYQRKRNSLKKLN